MAEELRQAKQQALADAINELRAATQRPAAQTEREAFEEWYAQDSNKQTGKPGWFTPKSIAELRDGDGYGEHRVMLNGKWEGWQARASLPAPQQATPLQEPSVFREYFDAHCALIAAKNASEKASHAHIVGYRAPSYSTGSEPYGTSVARNDQLKRADDAARGMRKEAEARFNAALSAAQSAALQATPERHLTVTTDQAGNALAVTWQDDEHRILEIVWERKQATPEPAGEPVHVEVVGEIVSTDDGNYFSWSIEGGVAAIPEGSVLLIADSPITDGCGSGDVYTRPAAAPAPAVPEGFALVSVEPTPEMMEAMPSLPAIGAPGDMELKAKGWSLKAIQNRHRWLAALAAAQAKGWV